jgi:hypothetical protein
LTKLHFGQKKSDKFSPLNFLTIFFTKKCVSDNFGLNYKILCH